MQELTQVFSRQDSSCLSKLINSLLAHSATWYRKIFIVHEINWPLAIRGKLIEQTYPHFTVTLEILSNTSISDKDMIFIFAHDVGCT